MRSSKREVAARHPQDRLAYIDGKHEYVERLEERALAWPRVELRHWLQEDAAALDAAVQENLDHLRPWMPWIAAEPMGEDGRRELIRSWEADRRSGAQEALAILVDGEVAGSCGLHRRIGPGGLEIGYWVARSHTGRGVATEVARQLCARAFADPEIDRVEIHHDRANAASGRIPERLGFELVGEETRAPEAPGEDGVERIWRLTREAWAKRKGPAGAGPSRAT